MVGGKLKLKGAAIEKKEKKKKKKKKKKKDDDETTKRKYVELNEDDDSDDDDGSEKPVESSYETFGNTNGTSNVPPHLALLEIKGKKSDHFGFVKVKKQRDLLVKRITKFVLA